MRFPTRILLLLVLSLSGCGPSKEQLKLDETFNFTLRQLNEVGRNPIASAAFESTMEQGGSPLDYVVAGVPEHADYGPIVWKGPVAPWTVVIKEGGNPAELVVEAYGEKTDQPTRTETAKLTPVPKQ